MSYYGIGSATGKIILMGEHAVVYGKPAIALPFSEARIETRVEFHDRETTIDCLYYNGPLAMAPTVIGGIKELIEVTLDYIKKDNFGMHLKVVSTLPPQRGLGSSAAVSVSIVRAIFDAYRIRLSDDDLSYLVTIAEKIHHINPSGLDANTIASGKAVFFERGKDRQVIPMDLDAVLVVADTGQMGQTKLAVQEVNDLLEKNPAEVEAMMNRLEALTNESRIYLQSNAVIEMGRCMNEAHQLLRNINVSDELLDHLTQVAIENGAKGAKLTGSGKGGCMIALCHSVQSAERVAAKLVEAGAVATWLYDLKGNDING